MAVSTGPTNGAFMLSVLSLLHGCVTKLTPVYDHVGF